LKDKRSLKQLPAAPKRYESYAVKPAREGYKVIPRFVIRDD